jgi:hypothetical protein
MELERGHFRADPRVVLIRKLANFHQRRFVRIAKVVDNEYVVIGLKEFESRVRANIPKPTNNHNITERVIPTVFQSSQLADLGFFKT